MLNKICIIVALVLLTVLPASAQTQVEGAPNVTPEQVEYIFNNDANLETGPTTQGMWDLMPLDWRILYCWLAQEISQRCAQTLGVDSVLEMQEIYEDPHLP